MLGSRRGITQQRVTLHGLRPSSSSVLSSGNSLAVTVEFADMSSEILGRDKNAPLAQRLGIPRAGRHMFWGSRASSLRRCGQLSRTLVRVIVPFSAGSMTDIMARSIADKLTTSWNQQVIVENRPGLAGTASVAKSPADGYTLMLTSNGHTVIGNLNKNIAFDPVKDFVGVTQVASTPLIMVTSPTSEYKSVKHLIEAAKAKPGVLNYSFSGSGQYDWHRGRVIQADYQYKHCQSCRQRAARDPHRRHPRRCRHGLHLLQRGRRPHSKR